MEQSYVRSWPLSIVFIVSLLLQIHKVHVRSSRLANRRCLYNMYAPLIQYKSWLVRSRKFLAIIAHYEFFCFWSSQLTFDLFTKEWTYVKIFQVYSLYNQDGQYGSIMLIQVSLLLTIFWEDLAETVASSL